MRVWLEDDKRVPTNELGVQYAIPSRVQKKLTLLDGNRAQEVTPFEGHIVSVTWYSLSGSWTADQGIRETAKSYDVRLPLSWDDCCIVRWGTVPAYGIPGQGGTPYLGGRTGTGLKRT